MFRKNMTGDFSTNVRIHPKKTGEILGWKEKLNWEVFEHEGYKNKK